MASDGKVVFQIEGDARGVKNTIKDVTSSIEKESKKWDKAAGDAAKDSASAWDKAGRDIKKDAENASKGIKDSMDSAAKSTEQSANQMGSSLKGMLSKIGLAALAAKVVKFAIDFGKASVQAASDLAEVQNVVDVTFEDNSRAIDKWAQSAGKNFGLTETAAKKYASTIGAMLKSQGITGDAILSMSENLAGLAADMASFYNLDFDTAFEKIRAGITGETMPLKQIGINMSVANLEAFALEQGITKSYVAMSQGEQTMLRYQYLMKATADAQGDFARTSDSMANASRRVSASWETIKTKGGGLLMQVIEPLTSGIADFLDELTAPVERTVLDDFADIDKDYSRKMAHMQSLYDTASDIVSIMEKLQAKTATLGNGQTVTFEKLFGDLNEIKQKGGDIREYINSLGLDANYIAQEYDVWQDSISRLTTTVPALTSVIDAQTGAIDGGTEAIKTNLVEWSKAEKQKYLISAYYAKLSALEEKQGQLGSYELEAAVAKKNAERATEAYFSGYPSPNQPFKYKAAKDLGLPTTELNIYGGIAWGSTFASVAASQWGDTQQWEKAYKAYTSAVEAATDAQEKYEEQKAAFGTAQERMAMAEEYLIELYGEDALAAINTGQAAEEGAEMTVEAAQTAKMAAQDAAKALADYVQSVRDSTESAVNSIINGFSKIERPTQDLFDKRSKLIEQQNELNRSTSEGAKKYDELQKQIDDLNKSMEQYTPKGMKEALESQLAFMQEYTANLEKARGMGLSDELLASLSDGSVQSAEYLNALVESPEMASEIDSLFQDVQDLKSEFSDTLADQKLSFDAVYDDLVDKAKSSVSEMDLEDEARSAMEHTINGLVEGIDAHTNDVQNAVNALNSILSQIGSGAVTFDLWDFGTGDNLLDGSHETGLDYVPFDNYLASLHEGEGILTAEENRIWQRFKNGAQPQTMDYDALGATMRENVQAGGNVYLDGKTVGRVISDQQGNAYRQLQRSGWQQ